MGKAKQRCSMCGASLTLCMCAEVPRLDLRTKVALVIHHRELSRSSNTGLLALQSLVHSELRIRGESREALDGFVSAMIHILKEAEEEPEHVKAAPHTMPVRRLDDVRAAKQLDLTWKPKPP